MNRHALHRHAPDRHALSRTLSRTALAIAARGAATIALLTILAGCGHSNAEPATAAAAAMPQVLTIRAKAADGNLALSLPARALASESAQLYARATGFVSERRAEIGDRVAAGQTLAVISTPEVDQAVRESQADLVMATAEQALAKVNLERAEALIGTGVVSREYLSDRKGASDVAIAARTAAQARVTSARERQSFQTIRAPFAGVVVARNIERGDRVVGDSAAVAAPLFEVNVLDPLRVVVEVPQHVALQILPGIAAEVSFPELPAQTFKAQVARSARTLSRDTGAMRTELRLANPDGRIPAGMVGTVRLQLPRAEPAVIVPTSSVIQRAGGAQLATVAEDSTLDFRDVRLGRNLRAIG
ncbi:MAG: efflux RND transporter periplasmic adaptor subunit [Luteimonas sp.]